MPKTILPAPPFTSFRGARSLSKTTPLVFFFRFSPFSFCTFNLDYDLGFSGFTVKDYSPQRHRVRKGLFDIIYTHSIPWCPS